MISEAKRIRQDSIAVADRCNGDVVYRAMQEVSDRCPNCSWRQHRDQYERLLTEYACLKVQIHRLDKKQQLFNRVNGHRVIEVDGRTFMSRTAARNYLVYSSAIYRGLMRKIGPCEDCKRQYNPHHRKRKKP